MMKRQTPDLPRKVTMQEVVIYEIDQAGSFYHSFLYDFRDSFYSAYSVDEQRSSFRALSNFLRMCEKDSKFMDNLDWERNRFNKCLEEGAFLDLDEEELYDFFVLLLKYYLYQRLRPFKDTLNARSPKGRIDTRNRNIGDLPTLEALLHRKSPAFYPRLVKALIQLDLFVQTGNGIQCKPGTKAARLVGAALAHVLIEKGWIDEREFQAKDLKHIISKFFGIKISSNRFFKRNEKYGKPGKYLEQFNFVPQFKKNA